MVNTLMILVVFCLFVCSISQGLNKITVEPSDVVEGEPVTLTCTLDSPRFISVFWYRNSTIVAKCVGRRCYDSYSYYNTTMNRLNGTMSIYIQNVSKSRDSVTWKCQDRRYGFSANTTLDVKELTRNLTLIRPENTRFIAGQSIDITCKTEVTYPSTNMTWYIDTADNRLTEGITTDIQNGISTSSLRLTPEKQLNNHSLYCSAFNGYGKVHADFLKLNVTYPPTEVTAGAISEASSIAIAEASSVAIVEGGQLLLTCSVQDANPRVPLRGYTWNRNGVKLVDQISDIFKVDTTSSHDTGNYTCTSNNGIGTGISSPVKVYVIPSVYEDKSGVVTGLAVGLALSMVLSIVLSLLVAYLMLTIRRSTTKVLESKARSRITPVTAPNNTVNDVSYYDGLELGNRDDNQYTDINATEQIQEYDNQTSDIAGARGDNSLYENVDRRQNSPK